MLKTYFSRCGIISSIIFLCSSINVFSQDTFSICAVDLATGQVGSAGATCITSSTFGVNIISDVHPGVGVIHTQAYWLTANQQYGKYLMNLGILTPQQIVDSMVSHDAGNNSAIRQYGVVDMKNGLGRSGAYTGLGCNDYKNHMHKDTLNYSYSVQGNILLGQQVLDSIESRFLNTPGTLACKLMAALQGGKVPGADTRCAPYGTSTFSAVLRVANPTDPVNSLYLDLYVNTYPPNAPAYMDPIDSLQKLFDQWGGCSAVYVPSESKQFGIHLYPNPSYSKVTIRTDGLKGSNTVSIFDSIGGLAKEYFVKDQKEFSLDISSLKSGIYFLKIENGKGETISARLVKE